MPAATRSMGSTDAATARHMPIFAATLAKRADTPAAVTLTASALAATMAAQPAADASDHAVLA